MDKVCKFCGRGIAPGVYISHRWYNKEVTWSGFYCDKDETNYHEPIAFNDYLKQVELCIQ